MTSIQQWLQRYGTSHRNRANKTLHWICIPPIVFSVFGLLRALPVGDRLLNVSTAAAALALVYYCALSWRLALGMLGVFALMYWGVDASYTGLPHAVHLGLMAAIFLLAWVGQFVGHKFEGVKPSFFEDLQFLLIGPLWLLADLYRRLHFGIDGGRVVQNRPT